MHQNGVLNHISENMAQLIDYQSMKIFLAFILLVVCTLAGVCSEPQKSLYMSFPTLSKRDTLANLFEEMSQNTTIINSNYTDSNLQANFKIMGLHPHPYYNDHHQTDTYVDKYIANVTMGVLSVSSFFNYSVDYSTLSRKGTMKIKGFLDPAYFTKTLKLTEGYLEWKPVQVSDLSFSQDFTIESTTPSITDEERKIFLKMLNNQAGIKRIRDQIINQMNALYVPLLVSHLNHEDLVSSGNITYKYRNITLQFANFAKEFELTNGNTKGLEVFLLFGLDSSTQNCTKLPTQFDEKEYGGLQQWYTFGNVRAMVKEAIQKGLFDVSLDKTWEVPTFQFYMGDLGNSVIYANYAPSGDSFKVSCKCNQSRMQKDFKVMKYNDHQIYMAVPESCVINYADKDIISIDMDISIIVKLVGEQDYLRVVVDSTGIFDFSATSLDIKYQVTDENVAKYSISEVLKGLEGKVTFGTDFPIIKRRYPVARVLDDSIIIFDPSEY